MTNDTPKHLPARPLGDIVNDLWGPSEQREEAVSARPVYQSTFPPFEQLWKVSDETVDWTDALVHEHPTDNMTSEGLWAFFHQHAEAVLSGRVDAYLEVLRAANPLGDLSPYTQSFQVETVSADRLRVRFTASPAYMFASEAEVRRYLAGVSLRAARDLMALLPVQDVCVDAIHEGKTRLSVCFERPELQKVRFGFIDPTAFVLQCGGEFE